MFYVAEAMLWEIGLSSRTHSGTHSLYGERIAKPGRLDPKYLLWMLDAFDQRLEGDYGFDASLTREDAAPMIEQASEFLTAAETLLSSSR